MSRVLVTGGTGALGTQLVPRLVDAGHDVVVLSRKDNPTLPRDVRAVRGDLATGDQLSEATTGIDVIAHLASGGGDGGFPTYKKVRRTDVEGTKRLIAEAKGTGTPHVVYISIVGIDKVPLGYYRAKLETEEVITSSGLPYSILRTTQWHTLAFEFCRRLGRSPLMLLPNLRMQLLDPGEVADRMVPLVTGSPTGQIEEMGGPVPLEMKQIAKSYLRAKGKTRLIGSLPLSGKTIKAFRAGYNLAPSHADGKITWDQWLEANVT